ncbi:MAG: gamma-glutamyltransferase [Bacteroidetes bacterium]|nr:MAG: gamma-glutamyltransferase [Bacteroidota bacterium]
MRFKFLSATIFLFLSIHNFAQDRLSGKSFSTRSEVMGTHGMVATSNPLATQVALEILKKGGSAVDAAIAANAMLALTEPSMCGPGGDLFAIVWDAKEKKLFGLNASGRSAMGMTAEWFKSKNYSAIPSRGPLSVSVPGCVDGWFSLHDKFGRLPMTDILTPAINYANEGIPVGSEIVDNDNFLNLTYKDVLDKNENFKKLYMPQGRFPVKGEIFKNPELANTLSKIAKGGRDAYYKGDIAKAIVDHITKNGGFLSMQDFANHHSEWVDPVSTNYRGYDVWELPPNGQGIAVLEILNILEGYNMASFGYGSKEHVHLFTEAKKLAYEDMAKYYGEPNGQKIPVAQLISKEYAAERRKLINPNLAGVYEPGPISPGHTIYLTVADKDGNMVSFIQSNAGLYGSFEVPAGLGFALQNRGASFELSTGEINSYAPGKRPFHTIIPAFVTKEGKPWLSFGVMGGDMQPQGHVQILLDLIDFKMSLQEAGDAPRINHSGTLPVRGHIKTPGTIQMESGFSYETIRALMTMGHQIQFGYGIFGGYQAIMFDGKVYYGASDPRKDGQAAGY